MATTEPRAPGWHPDPDDPASLRHWDGRRWGGEVRPRPSWAPPARPRPPSPAPGSRRPWLLLAGGAAVIAAGVVAVGSSLSSGPDVGPRTVSDRSFTDQAQVECARVIPGLQRDRPEPGPEGVGESPEVAAQMDRAADGLAALVARLRALPVAGAGDQARVDGWLADWDAYIGVGRRFADSLRETGDGRATELAAQGDRLSGRIFRFSKANGMPACTP